MTFISAQYQLIDIFEDKEEFKMLKMRFHDVLGKKKEEIWSLVYFFKVLGITKDQLFEGLLKNFLFHIVCANNVACDFTMADFRLINLNDLIYVAKGRRKRFSKRIDSNHKDFYLKEKNLCGN